MTTEDKIADVPQWPQSWRHPFGFTRCQLDVEVQPDGTVVDRSRYEYVDPEAAENDTAPAWLEITFEDGSVERFGGEGATQ